MLQTGQRVHRGDMDTYFVMYRGVRHYRVAQTSKPLSSIIIKSY